MALPLQYAWLANIDAPRTIDEALLLYGVKEKVGAENNPAIMAWAKETNIPYAADSVPWCGLFAAVVARRSGWPIPTGPLWARNWAKFGAPSPDAGLGDVLVFVRDGGGHVGFYVGEDATAFHVLGGNQGDAVSIVRIERSRCIAVRRPIWRAAQPASVKPYKLASTGKLSTNEA
jgi:uncharacterized protein (TIGR02594 family)